MHRALLIAIPLLGGCFQVNHHPICEEVSRTEIGMDEATDAGTANELLAAVAMDATFPGHYVLDDAPVDVDIWVDQDGPPVWVEQQAGTEKTRSFGFGKTYLLMAANCPSHIELPLVAEAHTPDLAIDVLTEGVVQMADPDEHWAPGVPYVLLVGSYADATLPSTEQDPAEWDDKYATIDLDFDENGLREGFVGWGGTRETDEYSSWMVDAAVRFAPEAAATTTGEP